jgi:Ser/Thr protein kinase RdoA (MazF antagonist)
MERRIKERYNESILSETMARYGIDRDALHLLDGFESFIYEYTQGEAAFILRIGHSLRRSADLVRGEVDWINHLAKGGAGVARAVESQHGRLVEAIDDGQGGHFLATAFVKASGGPPGPGFWTEPFIERYGRLLGRMHALAKSYRPADPAWSRQQWDDPIMLEVERWLPESDGAILARYRELLATLEALPKGPDSHGLIHQDAHAGNFFVDEAGAITLFDFDDCCYSWFANDIAIVLFYAVTNRADAAEFAVRFLPPFLRGYLEENHLDLQWLPRIPHFLKLREIDLYAVIHRSFDVDNLEDPWVAAFMENRRGRIAAGTPYLEFDFEGLGSWS